MSDRLLTIDVDAALAKISAGRLRSQNEVALALVRAAAAGRPKTVRLTLRRARLELDHDGQPPSSQVVDWLKILLEADNDESERHRALNGLEQAACLDLLVAFAVQARLVILRAGPPTCLRLVVRSGTVQLNEDRDARHTSLLLTGFQGIVSEWEYELERHLRYADFQVACNGRRLDRALELEDAVLSARFSQDGFEGMVGLPRTGQAARTRLVDHGVLSKDVWDSPPTGAVWDAVVRCPAGVEGHSSALSLVAAQVASLYRRLAGAYSSLGIEDRLRVVQLIFRLADNGAGAAAVTDVPVFASLSGELCTAAELRSTAIGRIVRAIGPGAKAERFELSGRIFRLDDRRRDFVERHLGLLVREPPRRATPRSRLRAWLSRSWRKGLSSVRQAVGRLAAARTIPLDQLAAPELTFRTSLERALDAGLLPGRKGTRVEFVPSKLFGWRWMDLGSRGQRLLLGRKHPLVRNMVETYLSMPASIYPAIVLLTDGRDAFGGRRQQAATQLAGLTQPHSSPTLPN